MSVEGPLLIAANHPNSFLDAIIVSTLFKRPVYSLARGDAFTNSFTTALLRSLNIFPVYRMSEGAENLEQNYQTFDLCRDIFKKNGIVLIFSEGRCINEWKLRPLKKGTARLAISSWQEGIDLKIIPAGINYHSFTDFGKNIQLQFGEQIDRQTLNTHNGYGKTIQEFNNVLKESLSELVVTINPDDVSARKEIFKVNAPRWKNLLLMIPAMAGYLLHAPLYLPVKLLTDKTATGTGHYDSIMVGLLFVSYPLYLAGIAALTYMLFGSYWWLLTLIICPFTAWSYVQVKKQF